MTAINRTFTAPLQKEPGKSAPICVVTADPAEYSGTRGLVRIRSRIDYLPFRGSFLAPGDGTHTLAVTADIRAQTGKQAGDAVTVHPRERIPPTPPRSAP